MTQFKDHLKRLSIEIIILFFLITGVSNGGYSQDLPKVIQPSPETSALFRFSNYPMDYSTGLPQISIPVYEVQSGSLSVPISISNHASGRRVTDQDGPVALGWSLNAGGMISCTQYGSADFGTPSFGTYQFPYPFRVSGLSNSTDLVYLEKIIHYDNPSANILPWTDGEYDVFSYSINNSSGKFIFKDNNGVKTATLLPYRPYIITPYYTFRGLSGIDITDDKGTLYKFVTTETSGYDNAVTGLAIKQIISADKTDTITFQYTGFREWRLYFSQQRTIIDAWLFPGAYPSSSELDFSSEASNQEGYQIFRLTEIDFKQGKVLVNLVTGSDKIDNIQVINLNNEVLKTIQFNRSQLDILTQGGVSGKPNMTQVNNKLDGLVFKDRAGASIENYSFQYYPGNTSIALDLHFCDWWGYYNASGNLNMLPDYKGVPYAGPTSTQLIDIINGGPNNREPDLEGLKRGVIKKIIYPTGGSTEFIYENNKYFNNSTNAAVNGPGLRIAQINTDDNRGTVSTKTYKYGVNEIGYGFLDLVPNITTMASELTNKFLGYGVGYSGTDRERTFYSGFIPELSAMAERPVIYTEVAEYEGTPTNNIGKTVYNYDNSAWAPSGMPAYSSQTIGKMHIYNANYWNNPSLIKKTEYKSLQNAGIISYVKRKETANNYTSNNIEDVAGLHVQRLMLYPLTPGYGANPSNPETIAAQSGNNIYTFSDYHIPVGIKNLTSTSETSYNDDNSIITNSVSYTYNTQQFVSQTAKSASDGNNILTQITYPSDYTGNAVLAQMISPPLNMLNYPVEQIESKNLVPLKSVMTNYFNWGTANPMFAPRTIDVKKGSNAYETRIRYYGYDDNGNPISVAKESDMLNSYIWDYRKSYPVAEVKNAASTDIAHTSFEADGTGNWTGLNTANIINDANAITGSKDYNFNGTTLSKPALTSSNTYIVSYWSKNGVYTVSGTPITGWPRSLTTITINGNSWTNWEHKVTGASTISISGTGIIDELRLFPANAQMSTFTYAPLIGRTSQNDMNNRVSYYEYDAFGRLKLIRDMNKNILKTFTYQYQSTTP